MTQLPYLTATELLEERQKEIAECLSSCEGHMVRSGYGIEVVQEALRRHVGKKISEYKALDCGSASGRFLVALARAGIKELYAADIDNYLIPEALAIVREFRAADFSKDALGWEDGFFDLITAWCIIPHLENPYRFVRSAAQVLRPGGLFFVSVPNVRSRAERHAFVTTGNFRRYSSYNNHIFVAVDDVLSKMMGKNGLRRREIYYYIPPSIFRGAKGFLRKQFLGLGRRLGKSLGYEYGVVAVHVFQKE